MGPVTGTLLFVLMFSGLAWLQFNLPKLLPQVEWLQDKWIRLLLKIKGWVCIAAAVLGLIAAVYMMANPPSPV